MTVDFTVYKQLFQNSPLIAYTPFTDVTVSRWLKRATSAAISGISLTSVYLYGHGLSSQELHSAGSCKALQENTSPFLVVHLVVLQRATPMSLKLMVDRRPGGFPVPLGIFPFETIV